ncbi:heme-dependent oxidative N-demethylase family protein [Pseudoroseicyclus tamaricis]|nr:DUF3445 domain-containing protein [Pseudoroseicyclus tamaricis]
MEQSEPITVAEIPPEQLAAAAEPLPRLRRLEGRWLVPDSAFAAQMALKERLISAMPERVLGAIPGSEASIEEAVEVVTAETGLRPEGTPLERLARATQADICLLQAQDGAHVLIAAALCFPSGWTLSEKLGRSMDRIHVPVPPYDEAIGRRVERMFANLRPGEIVWRANLMRHDDFRLFRAKTEAEPHDEPGLPEARRWLRSERQTLMRLPRSGAILFAIHTSMARSPAAGGA